MIDNTLPAVTLNREIRKNCRITLWPVLYRNEENAQNVYNDLLKSGFKARRIAPNNHGLFPVLYGSYATNAEAQEAMKKIHETNPDAWLLVKTL